MTDRPVYRPEHTVEFKAWIARPDYRFAKAEEATEASSEFAHKAFQVEIQDARGETVWKQQLTANAYGGIVGSYTLPAGATLGMYRINIRGFGGGSFRVEEYRKPEFEVTVEAPEKPLRLGEPFEANHPGEILFWLAGNCRYGDIQSDAFRAGFALDSPRGVGIGSTGAVTVGWAKKRLGEATGRVGAASARPLGNPLPTACPSWLPKVKQRSTPTVSSACRSKPPMPFYDGLTTTMSTRSRPK